MSNTIEKIKCPYCGEETSTVYTHCEKCNRPLKKSASGSGIFKGLSALFVILGVISTAMTWNLIGITSVAFLFGSVVSAAVIYGIGKIIDLLYQINIKLDK